MNQVTPEQKDSVTKTFAIVGFVAVILFAVWLAVQIVSIIPSAFNSLASIADGVYNYNEDQSLLIATKNSVVNTGEAFTISWTKMNRPGTYSFSYQCTDGTSASVRDAQGGIVDLNCDTVLNLGEKTNLDIFIESEKQRFVDVTYTIVYTPDNNDIESIASDSKITVVNATIPTQGANQDANEEKESTENGTDENTETSVSLPHTPNTITPGTPTTVEEVIYAIPVSDPNGTVDLKITYLGVGTLTGTTFTRAANINRDEQGAFQFAVENIGTKTSEKWSFNADLPSGITYTSKQQVELKPAEKAIITIGFDGLTQLGTEKFGVTLDVPNDVNTKNNQFVWSVEVVE